MHYPCPNLHDTPPHLPKDTATMSASSYQNTTAVKQSKAQTGVELTTASKIKDAGRP